MRLNDGRLVVFWNNCDHCPRVGKDGVYSGRDALHAAISDDEGKTWRGFREVYRDPTRNASPPKYGDRGTAYPHATVTKDGKILLVSGQGADLRRRFLIDPEWLLEKSQSENFANLDAWHLYKGFGQPQALVARSRARTGTCRSIPTSRTRRCCTSAARMSAMPMARCGISPPRRKANSRLRIRVEKGFGGAHDQSRGFHARSLRRDRRLAVQLSPSRSLPTDDSPRGRAALPDSGTR